MAESDILNDLKEELRLDLWWQDLIGQSPAAANFDFDIAEASLPRTEVVAAEAIHAKLGNHFSFTESRGKWFIWDGRIHVPCDGDGIAVKIVKLFYKAHREALDHIKTVIYGKADAIGSSGIADAEKKATEMRKSYDVVFGKHKTFRDRLATDAGLGAMVRVLRTECDVPGDHFDNDQNWFVMGETKENTWVVDLEYLRATGEFLFEKPDASRPVTKYFEADYDPQKNLGHWDNFLRTSIPNEEMRNYLQLVVGAAFMGESKQRCIPNLVGPPHTGKSVFVNTMFKLGKAGAGYAAMPDSRAVTKVSGQNFEQDHFKGRRFIAISEPSRSESIDDDFLKRFTGDVWVETRTLNVQSSGWVPQGIIFIASNDHLKINTRDKAIVERVQIFDFPVVFEKDHPDPDRRMIPGIEDLLLEDRTRVLTWILIGMREFVKAGRKLNPPESVLAKRGSIVTEASTALRWLEDWREDGLLTVDLNADPQYFITVDEAYMRYNMWSVQSGEKRPLTKRFFVQDIENQFEPTVRAVGKQRLAGILPTTEFRRRYEAPPVETFGGRSDF